MELKAIYERVRALAEEERTWAVRMRHELHQCPERALMEHQTGEVVARELEGLGLSVRRGVGGTGVVADLETARPGGWVALRADMDGLPVHEKTGAWYCSRNAGYAHACGHDGNMACVLGAARVLVRMREELSGRVQLIFQPAEEVTGGALRMLEEGLWDSGAPDAAFALHGWPHLDTGVVGARRGVMMASSTEFTVEIEGKGGHAARPQNARNPLHAMARIIDELDELNGGERVVTIAMARAGERSNVIADTGMLMGTVRVLAAESIGPTLREIEARVAGACAGVGMRASVRFGRSCPPLEIEDHVFDVWRETAGAVLGEGSVAEVAEPSMGAEDFAYYLQRTPGVLFRLGLGPECPELHSSAFDFADAAVGPGMTLLAALAARVATRGWGGGRVED
jgi:amidohydrolase